MRETSKKVMAGLSIGLVATALVACTQATSNDTSEVDLAVTPKGCIIAAYGAGCGGAPVNSDIPMNGLSTHALAANLLSANYDNSFTFVNTPLSVEGFTSSGLTSTLDDVNTRAFLRYTLRCAMTPSQSFVTSGTDSRGTAWSINERGVAGVCPEWSYSAADEDCQRRVSACLLADNNPLGFHVPISLRGPIELGYEPLRPRVPSIRVDKMESGLESNDLIPSFTPCSSGYGTALNCGWGTSNAIAYVGLCTPGDTIAIGTGGLQSPACSGTRLGSSPNDTVIRVCGGIRGCDSSAAMASNDDSCGLQSYVTFTCPSAEPGAGPFGAFSVMVASYNRSIAVQAISAAADLTANAAPRYPAPEVDVFSVREGAFFGNIFDRQSLTWTYTQTPNGIQRVQRRPLGQYPAQYQNAWSCSDAAFPDAAAHTNRRVCTTATEGDCLANPLGICQQGVCSSTGSGGAFLGCHSWNGVTFPALTTYLHSPADVLNGF